MPCQRVHHHTWSLCKQTSTRLGNVPCQGVHHHTWSMCKQTSTRLGNVPCQRVHHHNFCAATENRTRHARFQLIIGLLGALFRFQQLISYITAFLGWVLLVYLSWHKSCSRNANRATSYDFVEGLTTNNETNWSWNQTHGNSMYMFLQNISG